MTTPRSREEIEESVKGKPIYGPSPIAWSDSAKGLVVKIGDTVILRHESQPVPELILEVLLDCRDLLTKKNPTDI